MVKVDRGVTVRVALAWATLAATATACSSSDSGTAGSPAALDAAGENSDASAGRNPDHAPGGLDASRSDVLLPDLGEPPRPTVDAATEVGTEAQKDGTSSSVDGPGEAGPEADGGDGDAALAPDGPPPSDEQRYRAFLVDSTVALSKRYTTCFHSAPFDASLPGMTSGLWVSLRHGLAAVSDAAMASCLASIATASCDDLAMDKLDPSCSAVLVGQVANGHYCRIDDDCLDAAASFCKFDFGMACGSRCAPRAKVGQACTDVCGPGAFCQAQSNGSVCAPLLGEDQNCQGGQCAAGLYCQNTGGPSGKCKRIAIGVPCAGTWQCPGAYACLVPTGATTGACGPGRELGAVCRVLQSHGVVDSDCAPGLRCLPDGTGKNVCSLGRALDQTCAIDPVAPAAGEICREGFCSVTAPSVCTAKGNRNDPCSDDRPCADGLRCRAGTCEPEEIPAGEVCGASDDARHCAPGTFCKATSAGALCAPLRPENEACGREECAPPADCVNGVCRRCQ